MENSQQVAHLLKSAKFAHLATSNPSTNQPNVTLMNFIHLNETDLYKSGKDCGDLDKSFILFAVNPNATSFQNIVDNRKVSILIHDWTTSQTQSDDGSLAQMLRNLNQSELSTISATLNGEATIISDESAKKHYEKMLLEAAPDAKVYMNDGSKIVLMKIDHYKVVDSENNVEKK